MSDQSQSNSEAATPDADQGLTQQPAADAGLRAAPTADEQPTTPAPDQDTAAATTDRTQTTVEPADQQP